MALTFYFDLLSKELAATPQGPTGLQLPPFGQEEIIPLCIGVIRRISEFDAPLFESVQIAGWTLRASIGPVGTAHVTQNTFNVVQNRFEGTLNLNVAAINALTDQQQGIYLDLLFNSGSEPYRRRFDVRIEKAVWLAGALVAPAGDLALGVLEADRKYVKKEMAAGESILWKSADSTKLAIQYLHDDGSPRMEPIA